MKIEDNCLSNKFIKNDYKLNCFFKTYYVQNHLIFNENTIDLKLTYKKFLETDNKKPNYSLKRFVS